MKFTTLTAALLSLGLAADTASAACCNLKVCDGFGNKGNCMGGCYPYGKTVNIDRSGLKSSIGSAKTASDCKCTFGKNRYVHYAVANLVTLN